ncbi:DUF397 domain-containing protein [Streptomyces yerevanensis]|uniref:DUF397 domain-containing protein n=1 Tax=Streptomyces yerevanensis TaxID=66378 RepID=UPI000526E7E3|nr:DUF397 domain-containing protein [Streptomyces yerevanensis]
MSTRELHWFKSSYSDSSNGNDCVEVALDWFKSSYSDSSEPGDCVEVATTPATIHVRDSKNTQGPCLTIEPATWTGFVAHIIEM